MLQTQDKNSQLISWLQEQQKPHRLRVVMEKERQAEFIKQAHEYGCLLSPSIDFLVGQYSSTEGDKCVKSIVQIHLSNMRLKDIGDIGFCLNLKYCSLSGNYLTKFDALKSCTGLQKLDLHENQISILPSSTFWRSLPNLKIIYLHNNSIGRLSCLQNLGASPNLQVLTLFDTPISLKNSYRHHVVNSIWSLKALDFHVISDEEIIEDAKFGGQFSVLHNAFQFNPLLNIQTERTIKEEKDTVSHILREIAVILSKHSPVLIIQRYIRGFLGRCRARSYIATKVWASVTIQRHWRKYKGIKYTAITHQSPQLASFSLGIKPKSSKATSSHPMVSTDNIKPVISCGVEITDKVETETVVNGRLDYDTYLKNRRPGSLSPGLMASGLGNADVKPLSHAQIHTVQHLERDDSHSPTGRHRASIMIDLTKLEAAAELVPINVSAATINEKVGASQVLSSNNSSFIKPRNINKDKEKLKVDRFRSPPKQSHLPTVHEMLGPLDKSNLERELDTLPDEEEALALFRVSVLKSVLHHGDPTEALLIEKRETGKDIRASHRNVIDNMEIPKPVIKKKKTPNVNQRLFSKMQNSMGMASLRAVQQAYKDREKSENMFHKADYVLSVREQLEQGRERSQNYLEDRRLLILKKRDQDMCKVLNALQQHEFMRQDEIDQRREIRSKFLENSLSLKRGNIFASDFRGQHTTISKALLKHDWQTIKEDVCRRKEEVVKNGRQNQKDQVELVQRYLEHRKLMRQAQVAVERAALDSKILHEANDKLIKARSRVAEQKQMKKAIEAFYPLPKSSTTPVLPAVVQKGKPSRYETLISMYDGRVGNHPFVLDNNSHT